MQIRSFLKIWLLSFNFEKFDSIIVKCIQSQRCKTLDCDWSPATLIEVNFSNNQIFRNYFVFIYYHLCKISAQIIKSVIFAPYNILEWTYNNTIYSMI